MKKFKFLFLLSILPLASMPFVAAACDGSGTQTSLRLAKEHFATEVKAELAKYNVHFSPQQEQAYQNFDIKAYNEINQSLQTNAKSIFALKAELANDSLTAEQTSAKQAQINQLLQQNEEILSLNLLPYLKYLYNFTTKFYDYGLLTFEKESNTHAVHSPRYLHWAANVKNEFSASNEAIHKHFTYNRNNVKPNILVKHLTFSKLQDSEKKPGYKVLYVSFKSTILKIYVSPEGAITLDPLCIYFSQSDPTKAVNPQETLEAMEKNEAKLTNKDINLFEEKFATMPDIKYPQFNLIY
ncbi:variable surface lipoprotein [Mycoplasma sp. AA7A]|uniref:variable surface lipoprotein n=1 Tax=unclassified Mycoplasma TaxID=2683645 RepID=UPI003AAC28B6